MARAMTARKRHLRYSGDKTDTIHVGQAMGPGTDGFYRRVTEVTYDRRWDRTRVVLEVVELAPDGQRLRYHGDASGVGPLPAPSVASEDRIEPK
jgi:hypothetical protein